VLHFLINIFKTHLTGFGLMWYNYDIFVNE
jgi:hypothetical protein